MAAWIHRVSASDSARVPVIPGERWAVVALSPARSLVHRPHAAFLRRSPGARWKIVTQWMIVPNRTMVSHLEKR